MNRSNVALSALLTRRGFLLAVPALSVLSLSQWPSRVLAAIMDTDAFLKLSQDLVGKKALSRDIAAGMVKAYSAIGREDDVSALAAGESNDDLADSIVASWYTGESPNPDDSQVLTYTDALVWQAMDYTKPMAYCGGAMGYWADPPAV